MISNLNFASATYLSAYTRTVTLVMIYYKCLSKLKIDELYLSPALDVYFFNIFRKSKATFRSESSSKKLIFGQLFHYFNRNF